LWSGSPLRERWSWLDAEEELVGVTVVREDLRQLLLAADQYQRERMAKGDGRIERLDVAINRIEATANAAE
jgi:hypothetical protein